MEVAQIWLVQVMHDLDSNLTKDKSSMFNYFFQNNDLFKMISPED